MFLVPLYYGAIDALMKKLIAQKWQSISPNEEEERDSQSNKERERKKSNSIYALLSLVVTFYPLYSFVSLFSCLVYIVFFLSVYAPFCNFMRHCTLHSLCFLSRGTNIERERERDIELKVFMHGRSTYSSHSSL